MYAKEMIEKAKSNLVFDTPFFVSLLFPIPMKKDNNRPTMATDGTVIYYNSNCVESLSILELIGLMCHEIAHIMFLHHLRLGNRDAKLANKAMDYVINSFLIKAGFTLPDWVLLDSRFDGMCWEEVYRILEKESKNAQQGTLNQSGQGNSQNGGKVSKYENTSDPGGCGEVLPFPGLSEDERKIEEDNVKIKVTQAYNIAKSRGMLPAGLDILIGDLVKSKTNYLEILSRFVTSFAQDDYSWKQPNKRYAQTGIYLPSLYSEKVDDVILAIDTSGSVNSKELNVFAGECKNLCDTFNIGVRLLYFDSIVQGEQELESEDFPLNMKVKGGGGTAYSPIFEYLKTKDYNMSCLIVLTDGYCNDFPKEIPEYPVLWMVTDKKNFNPSFGEKYYIDGELIN